MTAPNYGPRRNDQSSLLGLRQARFEVVGTHMAGWFGEKKFPARSKGAADIGEQRRGVRHFMNHRERQRKINFARAVIDAEPIFFGQAGINPVGQPRPRRAPGQSLQHSWLRINGDHAAFRPDAAGQLEREESHPRSGFEDDHSLGYKRSDDGARVVYPPSQRDDQKIAEPPGTDSMSHEGETINARVVVKTGRVTSGFDQTIATS